MLKRKHSYLIIGIILSLISKGLQLQFHSVWGDVLVILAAIFFVLALLLSISRYTAFMENKKQRRSAKWLAVECCLTVVSFQLFALFTFGRGYMWGFLFLPLVCFFAGLSLLHWRTLSKSD